MDASPYPIPPPGQAVDLDYFAPARFARLFDRYAWRLEVLDEYDSPRTRQRIAQLQAGQAIDWTGNLPWYHLVTDARIAGRQVGRVHVIPERLTPYLRFELAAYQNNQAAGETVQLLPRDQAEALGIPSFDFWLFDGTSAAVLYYGARGVMLRIEVVTDPEFLASCRAWRDTAMSNAIPLDEYTERQAAA